MPVEHFFDTNILLYAYDLDAGKKRSIAVELVSGSLREPAGSSISVQVLQEFFVNFTRSGHSDRVAAEIVDDFSAWRIVANTHDLFLEGLHAKARWQLSLWDAMIVAAAESVGAPVLYTEDLNHGQRYGSVRAVNPFLESDSAIR